MQKTTYDWRVRGKTLMQTDIANPPIRHDVTFVGGHQERMQTFEYMYHNGYLAGVALRDAKILFGKEPAA